jgi:dolichol-phosphate mannosyltransferase
VVVPLCNEELNLPTLHLRLVATLRRMAIPYEIIYVDDGSTDRTAEIIRELNRQDSGVKGLFLSRNFGHQAAICAGLEAASGQTVVTIDGDLQDPPELIPELVDQWSEGYQIVYARRRKRQDNPLKQAACFAFYRVLRGMAEVPIPMDTGDFALMDRQVVEQLNAMPERTRFIRGLRTWVGFRQTDVLYDRDRRHEGDSKYSLARLARLGLDGIFSFSDTPLKGLTLLGLLFCTLGMVGVGASLAGAGSLSAMALTVVLMGGIQLVGMGVLGEYIGRIHHEVRGRPMYVTRERLGFRNLPRPVPTVLEFLPRDTDRPEPPRRLSGEAVDPMLLKNT